MELLFGGIRKYIISMSSDVALAKRIAHENAHEDMVKDEEKARATKSWVNETNNNTQTSMHACMCTSHVLLTSIEIQH